MALIKMNKHQVYDVIADNLDWFKREDDLRYLSCQSIGAKINKDLKKNGGEDPPQIRLCGSTLTAMVCDGVLERQFIQTSRCYWYRPILPINEEYKEV